jgi:hypothetical protein
MNTAIAVVTLPFRAVYWLTYGFLRLFGHPFMLFPALVLAWALAQHEGSGGAGFVVYGIVFLLVNRLLDVMASYIKPKPRLRGKIEKMPKPAKLPKPQFVSVAVGRHGAPSDRAIRRQLSPELRQLIG